MRCGICGSKIDKEHPFTNPKSHKKDCPIYATDKKLIEVIKREVR